MVREYHNSYSDKASKCVCLLLFNGFTVNTMFNEITYNSYSYLNMAFMCMIEKAGQLLTRLKLIRAVHNYICTHTHISYCNDITFTLSFTFGRMGSTGSLNIHTIHTYALCIHNLQGKCRYNIN